MEPDPQAAPEAAAAWGKIDQVYGRGTMNECRGKSSKTVFAKLRFDYQVNKLLYAPAGSLHPYNVVRVEEGKTIPGSANAKTLLGSFQNMNLRMRRSKKKWAQSFRSKINGYVYRKGNGNERQTWPLIRKVVLYGPWACLSTGACLVDLPGVRDANAARAKVSENYLQNCNQIWVVAPIKRAVDDGTAKELLGEQFKRRLLMDGQYGNVSFICTQTDDCEATEIMRDHSDIAQNIEGRWEKMETISEQITELEKKIADLKEEEEDLNEDLEQKKQIFKDVVDGLDESSEDVRKFELEYDEAQKELEKWRNANLAVIREMQDQCQIQQRELKALCATVRNEYSTRCLQSDFKDGLKALYRKNDEDCETISSAAAAATTTTNTALPENFEMDVHCISSNDYLKIQQIKPKSDGPPSTFSTIDDTQIPQLRMFVHGTTARSKTVFAKAFVRNTSDLLDRVKLLAVDGSKIGSGRSSLRCMKLFEREVAKIGNKIQPLTSHFSARIRDVIKKRLQPALESGSKKGIAAAVPICKSWGEKTRRTKSHRDATHNGLYWSTYMATARRNGVYTSPSAGAIDTNQELCDPMEKEFSVDWQRIMDTQIRINLLDCEKKIQTLCSEINLAIASEFENEGMDKNRTTSMSSTAGRGCSNAVKQSFSEMRRHATETQRNLNRSLLPIVQAQMIESYTNTMNATAGTGRFSRMKDAMLNTTKTKVRTMFDRSTLALLTGIDELVNQLVHLILQTSATISKHLQNVYSICWDDQSEQSKNLDQESQRIVRSCRDALLPDLNKLCKDLASVQDKLGIEREALELDVMAVECLDKTIQRKSDEAKASGLVIDLCDSDEEIENVLSRLPPTAKLIVPPLNVKAESM
jgi:hypothetical protein